MKKTKSSQSSSPLLFEVEEITKHTNVVYKEDKKEGGPSRAEAEYYKKLAQPLQPEEWIAISLRGKKRKL